MKPMIQPHVEIIPLPLECASGIMSSATMKIIAPAANAKPIGKIVVATDTARAPAALETQMSTKVINLFGLCHSHNHSNQKTHRERRKWVPPFHWAAHTRSSWRAKSHSRGAGGKPPNLRGNSECLRMIESTWHEQLFHWVFESCVVITHQFRLQDFLRCQTSPLWSIR